VGTDSEQISIDKEEDRKVCDLYLDGAINATQKLKMIYQPDMVDNLRISCLHDLMTTKDTTVSIDIVRTDFANANCLGWCI